MKLKVVGEVVLNPVPPAVRQRMVRQLALVVEAALLRQLAVHGSMFGTEANFASVQTPDKVLSLVDARENKVGADVKIVFWFRAEKTVVNLLPVLSDHVWFVLSLVLSSFDLSKTRERFQRDSSSSVP